MVSRNSFFPTLKFFLIFIYLKHLAIMSSKERHVKNVYYFHKFSYMVNILSYTLRALWWLKGH